MQSVTVSRADLLCNRCCEPIIATSVHMRTHRLHGPLSHCRRRWRMLLQVAVQAPVSQTASRGRHLTPASVFGCSRKMRCSCKSGSAMQRHRSHRCSFRIVSCIAAARRASRRLLVPDWLPAFSSDMLEAVPGTLAEGERTVYRPGTDRPRES